MKFQQGQIISFTRKPGINDFQVFQKEYYRRKWKESLQKLPRIPFYLVRSLSSAGVHRNSRRIKIKDARVKWTWKLSRQSSRGFLSVGNGENFPIVADLEFRKSGSTVLITKTFGGKRHSHLSVPSSSIKSRRVAFFDFALSIASYRPLDDREKETFAVRDITRFCCRRNSWFLLWTNAFACLLEGLVERSRFNCASRNLN